MVGIYVARIKTGITKLIHLRNVASVTLNDTSITFYYNFPIVTGESYYERIQSKPAYDTFTWATEKEAKCEFDICRKALEELQ
jgi:hypothetical protein